MDLKPAITEKSIGYGKSFASFGEIVQGRLSNGEDFLITIPIDLWNTCKLVCEPINGLSVIDTEFLKSKQVSEFMLEFLGLCSGVKVRLDFNRNIPIGKGLSSSTADMLAVVRAFQEVFDIKLPDRLISEMFTKIEPHDGLHYDQCVAYNHRQGRLLKKFNYIPNFNIIAVDAGGELSTIEYNKNLSFSSELLEEYDELYSNLLTAFAKMDDVEIARCAQKSTELHIQRTGNTFLDKLVKKSNKINSLGILTTHSGTCAGVLLSGNATEQELDCVEADVATIGRVFRTKTLESFVK